MTNLKQMQEQGREKLIEKYLLIGHPVTGFQKVDATKDLDQHTANTWKACLATILESGLLEEKPELPAERNWKRAEEIHRLEAYNTLARDIKEFISNMDNKTGDN